MSQDSSRYDRQTRLSQVGLAGQQRLAEAEVALVGLGALGSTIADLLARAGVGSLRLIDRDVVEWSNLQRQSLYTESDARAGLPKALAAADRLGAVNSAVRLDPQPVDLVPHNAQRLLGKADLVLDGTDNFDTRYLINDWTRKQSIPWVYAGVVSTYGMVATFLPHGPCLRCTYPEPPADPPTCRSDGVLGPAVGMIASLAAIHGLKVLLGDPTPPGFHYLECWSADWKSLAASVALDCPCCGLGAFPWLDGERGNAGAAPVCGGGAVRIPATHPVALPSMADRLRGTVEDLTEGGSFLRFREGSLEVTLFPDGSALVRGTEEVQTARSLLARTIGR